ncbi:MAG: N-acetyltransferase family protein [Eggerthellaceae bacterium]|nr:N-acetyltransferase family protein [Eggerthellaceae bacterium]
MNAKPYDSNSGLEGPVTDIKPEAADEFSSGSESSHVFRVKDGFGTCHEITIRKACGKDLEGLREIYNHEVLNGFATFDTVEQTAEEWNSWAHLHDVDPYILLSAVADSTKAVGYGALSAFRERGAYGQTAELSLYVHQNWRGLKIGSELLKSVIGYGKNNPQLHLIVSMVAAENSESEHLHEKFGFAKCGTLHEVGFKFEKYRDVDLYEMMV